MSQSPFNFLGHSLLRQHSPAALRESLSADRLADKLRSAQFPCRPFKLAELARRNDQHKGL